MARTASTMLPLGTPAPQFRLPDPRGTVVALEDFDDAPALVVTFICNHCPYVKHVAARLAEVGRELQEKGVPVVAINSNDADAYPEDAPDAMVREVKTRGYTFPYLVDADQSVAQSYRAACTPDFFVFDAERRLTYRGQFDDSRPSKSTPVTGADLLAAVELVLNGDVPGEDQKASMGCSIKWKPGNEPNYFA